MEYTFTLKYQLPSELCDPAELMERLGAAGCEDALIGMGLPGRVALEFTREASSAHVALVTALADVRRALPGATLIEAVPDFVGLSDVADAVGVSRQNMRKLMLTHAANFPAPVHCGTTSIWHLADILAWLQDKGSYELKTELREIAAAAMQVNLAKAASQALPRVQQQLSGLIA
jgi:predicted DNA-binding transcriptional regulator AlpA